VVVGRMFIIRPVCCFSVRIAWRLAVLMGMMFSTGFAQQLLKHRCGCVRVLRHGGYVGSFLMVVLGGWC
jgi:hypothetical protein